MLTRGVIIFQGRLGRARGRERQPITDFPTGSIFAIDAAADGKTLCFLYGNTSNDIVLLRNFR